MRLIFVAIISFVLCCVPHGLSADEEKNLLIERARIDTSLSYVTLEFATDYNKVPVPQEAGAVVIDPPVKGFRVENWYYSSWHVYGNFEPRQNYTITIKAGLKAEKDYVAKEDLTIPISVPDIKPSCDFLSRGPFFPAKSRNFTLPLNLVNLKKLSVKISKIYENNLIPYRLDSHFNEYREKFLSKHVIDLDLPLNKVVKYTLELNKYLPKDQNGIFTISLKGTALDNLVKQNNYWETPQDRSILVLSNLALTSAIDHEGRIASVVLLTLNDSTPVQNATITLYSQKNQIIAQAQTDKTGAAKLPYQNQFDDKADKPSIITAKTDDDFTFIEISNYYSHDLAIFNNDGKKLNRGPVAFLYTERGAARPDETIHVSALVRQNHDKSLNIAQNIPAELKIIDPNGIVLQKTNLKTDQFGFASHPFIIPEEAHTGYYTATLGLDDEAWGTTNFIVATYVPDKIKIEVKPKSPQIDIDEPAKFTVKGDYYFGSPVENASCKLKLNAEKAKTPPHWSGYAVGNPDDFFPGCFFEAHIPKFSKIAPVECPSFTKLEGKAFVPVELDLSASIMEPGGRAVTGHAKVIALPTPQFLGLKHLESKLDSNKLKFEYRVLAFDKDAKTTPLKDKVTLELYKCQWDYTIVREAYGSHYNYEWTRRATKIATFDKISLDETGGTFELDVKDNQGDFELIATAGKITTKLNFFSWWGDGGARTANPKVLSFTTDKPHYLPGDTATVTFKAAAQGQAFAVLGSESIDNSFAFPIAKGNNSCQIQIPKNLQGNTYNAAITVITHRTSRPDRLFGLLQLNVKRDDSKLKIQLEAPSIAKPNETIDIKATIENPAEGFIHLFAVDTGILSLTDFATPDIHTFFYGKRFFDPMFQDNYSLIFPDIKIGDNGQIGGDMAKTKLARKLDKPQGMNPAIVVLKPIPIPEDGIIKTTMKLPDHLGSMRLMAVVSTTKAVGSAETSLIVRDVIDISASAPRAVAPGDRFTTTIMLLNNDLETSPFTLTATYQNQLKPITQANGNQPQTITLNGTIEKGKQQILGIDFLALEQAGTTTLDLTLKIRDATRSIKLPMQIRHLNPNCATSNNIIVYPNQKHAFSIDYNQWIPGTVNVSIITCSTPTASVKNALAWLDNYPYGCLEQTLATALPYLYLDDLAKAGFITTDNAKIHRQKLTSTYSKLLSMKLPDGTFTTWENADPTQRNIDGTLMAAHVIFESANQGIQIQKEHLDEVANAIATYAQHPQAPRGHKAYAAFALAIANHQKAQEIAKNILADKTIDFAALLASAALAKAGYPTEAIPTFNAAVELQTWHEANTPYRYASETSRMAMALLTIIELTPQSTAIPTLANQINAKLRNDEYVWGTTQDNAWATVALAAFAARFPQDNKASATIQINNNPPKPFNPNTAFAQKLDEGNTAVIHNTGKSPIFINYTVDGIPRHLPSQKTNLVTVERQYLGEDGKPSQTFKQGDLVTIQITLTSIAEIKDAILLELLPGGLEIEDPLLATRANSIPKEAFANFGAFMPQFADRRDDRFIIFGDLHPTKKTTISFQARAVTKGQYTIPSTLFEAMYNPNIKTFADQQGILLIQ